MQSINPLTFFPAGTLIWQVWKSNKPTSPLIIVGLAIAAAVHPIVPPIKPSESSIPFNVADTKSTFLPNLFCISILLDVVVSWYSLQSNTPPAILHESGSQAPRSRTPK